MNRPADFERLGDVLGEACGLPAPRASTAAPGLGGSGGQASAGSSRDPARQLAITWPEVVGAEVAAHTRPVQFRQGRLAVSASSSVWAQTLQLMSEAIVSRLNERLGPGTVEQIAFRHAGWEERLWGNPDGEPAAPDRSAPLSPEQEKALAAVEQLDLAPELRQKITRAMRAAFIRGQQDFVR